PVAHDAGAVGGVAVDDQHDLAALGAAHEALDEVQEQWSGEALLEDAEAQCAGVGDRGDHVRLEALAGALDDGGLTDWRPRGAGRVIGAHPQLVGPQDLGSVLARLALDLRVDLLEPGAYLRFGLRVGAPERLLRAEAPTAQVAPRGFLGDPDREALLDQLADQRPGPQEPGQLQLIGG